MTLAHALICFKGILVRESLRFLNQRARFFSALVRPLVWLFIFAAGFRSVLGVSIIPPYQTYILYEAYITPGLLGMILLFNGMQSSLSMIYDREMGSMRLLLVSPLPRWFLLLCKLMAGVAVAIVQVYVFLLIAWLWDIRPPPTGYLMIFPTLIISGLMLGALGLMLSSFPLWRVRESSELLYWIAQLNPFTHAVEFVRFALYLQFNWQAGLIVVIFTIVFLGFAILGYDPLRGLLPRKGGAAG